MDDTERMDSGRQKLSSLWLWIGFVWLAVGLLNATQIVLIMHAEGMQHSWFRLFVSMLVSWAVWALATPFIVQLGRRFPPIHFKPISAWLIHLSACAATGLAYAAWKAFLEVFLRPWAPESPAHTFRYTWFVTFYDEFHLFLILYAAILAISYTLDSRAKLAAQATEAARLNEQLSKAQLDALRHQLEPHFLFNSLNAIAGLVRETRNDDAVEMIARLSDLLRRVLDGSGKQEVSLGEEMEFLEMYLDIQKTRFAERLQVNVDVSRELYAAQVPNLILQPIVENAIQHGISKRAAGGAIRIAASRDDGVLTMSVHNDGPQLPFNWEHARPGIGISNVRTRLKSLYGDAYTLNIWNHKAGGVEVSLSVPFKLGSP
jgi:two-component system LytT family sensor kinase